MITGKTTALTRQTFVGKAMSLLFKMLSRFVITFLPRTKPLLISWLLSPSAVILEPPKIVCHCFQCFPIYLPWRDGTRCHDLSSEVWCCIFPSTRGQCSTLASPLRCSLSNPSISPPEVIPSVSKFDLTFRNTSYVGTSQRYTSKCNSVCIYITKAS